MALWVVPLLIVAVVLVLIQPLLLPVSLLALAHAWVIPELFANRGAGVVRVPRGGNRRPDAEQVAQGLLGDLLAHEPRELQRRRMRRRIPAVRRPALDAAVSAARRPAPAG
jgi:hypothetical protein